MTEAPPGPPPPAPRTPRHRWRRVTRILAQGASVKVAVWLIVGATVATVLVGSIVIWAFDKRDFPTYAEALWFSLQTVTTVGYGDVTPTSALGRVVGGVVMVLAIGFTAIVTAAVTSSFIEAARRRRADADLMRTTTDAERLGAALAAITTRLDRIEQALASGDRARAATREAPTRPPQPGGSPDA